MQIKEILSITKEFLNCPTAPFRETYVQQYIRNFLKKCSLPFKTDSMGNLFIKGKGPLTFVAHMDHPGFIAEKNSTKNQLTALFYGGYDPDQFSWAPVRFFSDQGEVTGIIRKWAQVPSQLARRAYIKVNGKVNTGDIGTWDFPACNITKNKLYSRACDDLVGCAILLCAIRELSRTTDLNASFLFTTAEEAGLHGAKYVCQNRLLPKNSIAVSVECSRELPGVEMGKGVIIRVGDSKTIFTPSVTSFFTDLANQLQNRTPSFSFQRKLMDGGRCEGTVFDQFGYKTGAICVALGNYHNRNFERATTEPEYVNLNDLQSAVIFILNAIQASSQYQDYKKKKPDYVEKRLRLGQIMYLPPD